MTILYFVITLGVLIFIHEFGHFIVAKRSGVRVEVFSLGFGPKLFGVRKGETLYKVSALPLGGYVKLTGEDPSSEDAGHPRSFAKKSLRQRFAVVFAGPAMNLLLALVLMPLVFILGRPMPAYLEKPAVVTQVLPESVAEKAALQAGDRIVQVDGAETATWEDLMQAVLLRPEQSFEMTWQRDGKTMTATVLVPAGEKGQPGALGVEPPYLAAESPRIDAVSPGGAAAVAGLQEGDAVSAVNGVPIQTWSQMSKQVQASKGQELTIEAQRAGSVVVVQIKPTWDEGLSRYLLGVRKNPGLAGERIIRKYPFWAAVKRGTAENIRLSSLTLQVVGRLLTFQLSYKSLGGPIRIAQASASAAESGLPNLIFFMAFLSIQLGILNLLPIPVLDGGHLFFMGFEAILRRPVSQRVQGIATQVGLFVLLFLMLIVTVNDIDTVWGFREIFEKLRGLF